MTSEETPNAGPTTEPRESHVGDASESAAAPSTDIASEAARTTDDVPSRESEATGGEASKAPPDDENKPKRKRKRRRKKKGSDGAHVAGTDPAPSESRDDGVSRSRRTNKPPRHRPPSERAPFHVGEEVFGKVTSVLDAAIMVDLSGKALAIFDRSEMDADDSSALRGRPLRRTGSSGRIAGGPGRFNA